MASQENQKPITLAQEKYAACMETVRFSGFLTTTTFSVSTLNDVVTPATHFVHHKGIMEVDTPEKAIHFANIYAVFNLGVSLGIGYTLGFFKGSWMAGGICKLYLPEEDQDIDYFELDQRIKSSEESFQCKDHMVSKYTKAISYSLPVNFGLLYMEGPQLGIVTKPHDILYPGSLLTSFIGAFALYKAGLDDVCAETQKDSDPEHNQDEDSTEVSGNSTEFTENSF